MLAILRATAAIRELGLPSGLAARKIHQDTFKLPTHGATMPVKSRKHDLPLDVRHKLTYLLPLVRSQQATQMIWRKLPTQEQSLVIKSSEIGPDILDIWLKLRMCSVERAVFDMAFLAGFLSPPDHTFYRDQIGEPVIATDPDDPKPCWDVDRGQLWFQGQLIRKVRGKNTATSIRAILDAFQSQGWPGRIADPLDPPGDPQNLRESIKTLNKYLNPKRLLFQSDGSGTGVTWSPK